MCQHNISTYPSFLLFLFGMTLLLCKQLETTPSDNGLITFILKLPTLVMSSARDKQNRTSPLFPCDEIACNVYVLRYINISCHVCFTYMLCYFAFIGFFVDDADGPPVVSLLSQCCVYLSPNDRRGQDGSPLLTGPAQSSYLVTCWHMSQ